jgi:hypothetical protein
MSPKPWEIFALLAGLITIIVLKLAPPNSAADLPSSPDSSDAWETPYYMRYNAPVMTSSRAVAPRANPFTFALGVPANPIVTQKIAGY